MTSGSVIAFGNGLAHQTGVKVQWHSGSPKTDGDSVWLDNRPPRNRVDFDAKCGTAGHELAHVWFNTAKYLTVNRIAAWIAHKYCPNDKWVIAVPNIKPIERINEQFDTSSEAETWLKNEIAAGNLKHPFDEYRIQPRLTWAAHECLNVVVDVYDERRMEALIPSMPELFRTSNLLAVEEWYEDQRYQKEAYWRMALLLGIMSVRLESKSKKNSLPTNWDPIAKHYKLKAMKCWLRRGKYKKITKIRTILNSCRETQITKRRHRRTRLNWTAIQRRAEKLFELIKDDIQDQQQQSVMITILAKKREENEEGENEEQFDDHDPMKITLQVVEITTAESDKYDGVKDDDDDDDDDQYQNPHHHPSSFDNATFERARHNVAQAADVIMATHDAMKLRRHDTSGHKLSRNWSRAFTDQRMFMTTQRSEGEGLNLALLLDRSGSMEDIYPKAAAICKAFASELTVRGANVKLWLFDDDTIELDWDKLDVPHPIGGLTYGGDAFAASKRWLDQQQRGRRMVIVITDGDLDDRPQCSQQYLAGCKACIDYLLIGLDRTKEQLMHGWPLGMRGIGISQQYIDMLGDQLIQNVDLD